MSDSAIYREFTKAREGGLSKDKSDSRSKWPVPDGTGNHTNSGISWKTFVYLGPILGYDPTPANFYAMTKDKPEIFDKIYDHFWEESGANQIKSQPVSHYVFQGLWGGGYFTMISDIQKFFKGAVKVTGDMEPATSAKVNVFCGSNANEMAFFIYCHEKRILYLKSCKTFKKHGKGWLARMEKLKAFNLKLINGK